MEGSLGKRITGVDVSNDESEVQVQVRLVHRDVIVGTRALGEYKSSHRHNHRSSTTLARSPTCKLVVWSVPPGTGIVVWSVAGNRHCCLECRRGTGNDS